MVIRLAGQEVVGESAFGGRVVIIIVIVIGVVLLLLRGFPAVT